VEKVSKYLSFLKKNQSKWKARDKRDFTKIFKTKKKMGNSMTKHREMIEDKKIQSEKQGVLKKGVVFFNSRNGNQNNMLHHLNSFLDGEFIYELSSTKVKISDIKEMRPYLILVINKVTYENEDIKISKTQLFNNGSVKSVRLDYEIRCLDKSVTEMYYKLIS